MGSGSFAPLDDLVQAHEARSSDTRMREMEAHHAVGSLVLSAAALFEDAALDDVITGIRAVMERIGARLDLHGIPTSLARGGVIGRIGVPREAAGVMLGRRLVIGANLGADPLSPVSRLWRGMQRRADVIADMRSCITLPGSAAARAGNERDVVLFSQRTTDRAARRGGDDAASALHWNRARQAADLARRCASSEQRELLLVLPVGRGTASQRYFADALERNARQHRMPPPRAVKAGLLSALLSSDSGRQRWLVASVMPMDELIAVANEAIGDTGPWPVLSIGTHASFFDVPARRTTHEHPVAGLLVLIAMLERIGQADRARALLQSLRITSTALERMEEELGAPLSVPAASYLAGVVANLGRAPLSYHGRDRRRAPRMAAPAPTHRGATTESDAVA